ncbi:MAG: hypothetical protein ACYC10_06135 [Allorhizobium sp.]
MVVITALPFVWADDERIRDASLGVSGIDTVDATASRDRKGVEVRALSSDRRFVAFFFSSSKPATVANSDQGKCVVE